MTKQRLTKMLWVAFSFILFAMSCAAAADGADVARAAFQARDRGQFITAIGLFNEVMKDERYSKDQRGLLLFGRGSSYQQLGMQGPALADLDGAIALLPTLVDSYVYRALIWMTERRYDEAIADLQQAHQLAPKDPNVLINLGTIYAQSKQLELAIENFDQAIRLRPDFDKAYYDRASAYLLKHDSEHAMQDFDKAIELRPTDADAFANRGSLHLANGEFEKALADLDRAVELAPHNARYRDPRANIYLTEGRYGDALRDFDEALNIDPGNPALYFGRGRTNLFLDDTSAAIGDLKIGVRLRPTDPNIVIWLHIARLHSNTADTDELAANAARVNRGIWPSAVLDLYQGLLTPAELRTKAQDGAPEDLERRACEAEFYVGDYAINQGRSKDALDIVTGVISRCRPFPPIYAAAQAELKLLQH
jgi:tetratricopeptide (TPR) repeat protein